LEIRVKDLLETIVLLKPAVPKKPTIKALSYIRLGEGKAMASDLETMVIAALPQASEPMLLPYADLADTLKYVDGLELLTITAEDRKVTITWSGGNASYPTESLLDFPLLPEMPTREEGELDGDTLIPAMLAALPYASTETERPVLNGVTLVLGNPIEVAAADGFRMSHKVLGISFPLEEKIVVPSRAVTILGHVFAKTPRTPPLDAPSLIQVITAKRILRTALVGENKLRVSFGTKVIVICNLIEGTPPNYLALVPTNDPILQSEIFAPQMEAAVKRVRGTAKDGTGLVSLAFADGKLTVSSKYGDKAVSATLGTIATQGEPGATGINQKYLLSFLAGKQGIITFTQFSDTAPLIFEYQNEPKVVIMPMFVENPPAAEETEEPEPETTEENTAVEPEEEMESSLEDQADERDSTLNAEEEAVKAEQETGEDEPVTKKPARKTRKTVTW